MLFTLFLFMDGLCSFKSSNEIFLSYPFIQNIKSTMDNYSWALGSTGSNLPQYLANSLLAAALTALMTAFASTGGYAFRKVEISW